MNNLVNTRLLNVLSYLSIFALISFVLPAHGADSSTKGKDSPGAESTSQVYLRDVERSAAPLRNDETIQNWLDEVLLSQLGLSSANHQMKLFDDPAPLGSHTVRSIQQLYRNIPIEGRELRLILDDQEKVLSIIGDYYATNSPSYVESTATISAEAAQSYTGLSDPRLITNSPTYFVDSDETLHLSWIFESEPDDEISWPPQRITIDANSGEILDRAPLLYDAMDRKVVDFGAACDQANVRNGINQGYSLILEYVARSSFHRSEGDPLYGNRNIDSLYDLLGDAYYFIQSVLKLDSLDDNGLPLKAIANISFNDSSPAPQCVGNTFNAFWRSDNNSIYIPKVVMPYIEVVAHELAHGITSHGSDLTYRFESGALNESISDAIGVSFRAWYESGGRHGYSPANIQTFDDVWNLRGNTGAARNMRSPSTMFASNQGRPYPDHYRDRFQLTESADHGGVHSNSSIVNQAFYLLAAGGKHPRLNTGPDVSGVGIARASLIFAQASHHILTPSSNFQSARFAFADAAEAFFGRHSEPWIAVHEAMDAVGIPGVWERLPQPPASEPTPAPVPSESTSTAESEPNPTSRTTPSTPVESTSQESLFENNPILLMIPALFVLIGAIVILLKFRPEYGTATASSGHTFVNPNIRPTNRQIANRESAPTRKPIEKNKQGNRIIGSLNALAENYSLPLNRALLASSEGLVIGRSSQLAHIILEDPRISRRHLRLRLQSNGLILEDLNSTQGTSVDGNPIDPFDPVKLKDGQLIGIAGISFALVLS